MLSLQTRHFREAEHQAALLDQVFATALERATSDMSVGGFDLGRLLKDRLREALAEDRALRLHNRGDRPLYGSVPCADDDEPASHDLACLSDLLAEAREALAKRDARRVSRVASELIERHRVPADMRRLLTLGLLEVEVRFYEETLRRSQGRAALWLPLEDDRKAEDSAPAASPVHGLAHGASPALAVAPSVSAPSAPAIPVPSMSSLVDPFFARREALNGASHHDMNQDRTTLRLFKAICGDRTVDQYHRGDVTLFLDTLRKLPTTYGKSPKDRDRTVAEIIAAADASEVGRLSEKTVKRHHSALTQFFQFAVDTGHLSVTQRTELTTRHRFRQKRVAREQRDAWTPDELKCLFASPVWTGCAGLNHRASVGPHIFRDSKFWLPLLALFHGARLEELADLYRSDVQVDEWQGREQWVLRISEAEGTVERRERRLKTAQAVRVLPLHPELIALGFLAYVQGIAPNAHDPIFPDLKPQGPDGKRGPRFTRWFVEHRKKLGLYRRGVGIHSFRHTAITRLTDAITDSQQERHRDFLMGHANGGSEGRRRYDKGPGLRELAGTLALLRFPELDLRRLHVWSVGSPLPDESC